MTDFKTKLSKEEINKLSIFEALLEVQKNLPMMKKSANGYGYKYTELAAILDVVLPICGEFGLFMTCESSENAEENTVTVTTIFYKGSEKFSGYTVTLPIDMQAKNKAQLIGSLITYGRRYSLCATLSIAETDKDAILAGSNLLIIKENQYEELSDLIRDSAKASGKEVTEIENWAKKHTQKNNLAKLNQEEFFEVKDILIERMNVTKNSKTKDKNNELKNAAEKVTASE